MGLFQLLSEGASAISEQHHPGDPGTLQLRNLVRPATRHKVRLGREKTGPARDAAFRDTGDRPTTEPV